MTGFVVKKIVYDKDGERRERGISGALAGAVGVACNAVLCAFKLAVGLVSGSVSITADAVNNLSDAGSSAVTLLSFKIASKPADKEHPYGHARVEYLAGALISVVILLLGLELASSSLERILTPAPASFGPLSFAVLAAGVAVKLWMSVFYGRVGREINSSSLKASSADSRNDVVTTLGVMAGALVEVIWHVDIDGYVGAAVAAFILISGVSLLKEALSPLIGAAPPRELVESITGLLAGYDEIIGTHDLMVHSYGPGREFATVHAEMPASLDPLVSHGIIDNIERRAERELGVHLVIHYDPVDCDDETRARMLALVEGIVADIDPRLSVHDLRVVAAHDHTNVVFDVSAPWGFPIKNAEIKRLITAGIKAQDETIFPVLEVEHGFESKG